MMKRESDVTRAIRMRKLSGSYRRIMLSGVLRMLGIAGVVLVLVMGAFGMGNVRGDDMYPALRDGDSAIYYRNADYMNGDVVMYRVGDEVRCGRIQAVCGSVISRTRGGQITIDGNLQPVQERIGIYSETTTRGGMELPCKVGAGEYFILGDNRKKAEDSRVSGCVREEDILGKAFLVIRRRAI